MKIRISTAPLALLMLSAFAVTACHKTEEKTTTEVTPASPSIASPSHPAFINKVWKVGAATSTAPGQLYVFLSDKTLLITGANGTPALGRWDYKEGRLSMTEEGQTYDTDIIELSSQSLKIRSHNPGGAVDIELVSAEESLPEKP